MLLLRFYKTFKKFAPLAAGSFICLLGFALVFFEEAKQPVRLEIEGTQTFQAQSIRVYRTKFLSSKKEIYPAGGVWETRKTVLSLILTAPLEPLSLIEKVSITVGNKTDTLSNSDIKSSPGLKISENSFVLKVPAANLNYEEHLKMLPLSFAVFLLMSFICNRTILRARRFPRIFTATVASIFFCVLAAILSLGEYSLLTGGFAATAFFFMVSALLNFPPREPSARRFCPTRKNLGNPLLFIFLFTSLALCLRGINWGVAEAWDPDQMALNLSVSKFERPHFVSLMHLFLSRAPVLAADALLNLPIDTNRTVLLASRLIHLAMFLGCGVFIYAWAKKISGEFSAALAAGLFVLSPGYGSFSKFLTAEIPLTFLMFAAFNFCVQIAEKGNTRNYLMAGLLAGIAASAKYYGVAVCASMAVAHFIGCRNKGTGLKDSVFSRNFTLGICWIPLGFFLGDPFALVNFKEFLSDFLLNSTVVPVYDGNMQGLSFFKILSHSLELFSPPVAALVLISNIFGFYLLAKRKISRSARILLIASWSVFAVYFLTFGFFPRSEVRFSVPYLAFFVAICAVFLSAIGRKTAGILTIPVFIYCSACLWIVGNRFVSDPRMDAIGYLKGRCEKGCFIENNHSSPNWDKIIGSSYKTFFMPSPNNLTASVHLLGEEAVIAEVEKRIQMSRDFFHLYTEREFERRNPDFIALNLSHTENFKNLFPEINRYYANLLEERYGCRIVFDRKSHAPPEWAYPKRIDSLAKRMVIMRCE